MKYPSKVSYGLVIFVFLVFYGPLIPALLTKEYQKEMIVVLAALSLIFAFILHLFFGTSYTIEKDRLLIKCGFFKYKPIKIDEIKEISNTKSLLSCPAPSFDRIIIKYGKYDAIIISPKDKRGFVKDLVKINSKIKNNIR